jgi:hypothetical protein
MVMGCVKVLFQGDQGSRRIFTTATPTVVVVVVAATTTAAFTTAPLLLLIVAVSDDCAIECLHIHPIRHRGNEVHHNEEDQEWDVTGTFSSS